METKKVIDHLGNKGEVADFLKISRQAVHAWSERVPERQAARLDQLTQGQLKYDIQDYIWFRPVVAVSLRGAFNACHPES